MLPHLIYQNQRRLTYNSPNRFAKYSTQQSCFSSVIPQESKVNFVNRPTCRQNLYFKELNSSNYPRNKKGQPQNNSNILYLKKLKEFLCDQSTRQPKIQYDRIHNRKQRDSFLSDNKIQKTHINLFNPKQTNFLFQSTGSPQAFKQQNTIKNLVYLQPLKRKNNQCSKIYIRNKEGRRKKQRQKENIYTQGCSINEHKKYKKAIYQTIQYPRSRKNSYCFVKEDIKKIESKQAIKQITKYSTFKLKDVLEYGKEFKKQFKCRQNQERIFRSVSKNLMNKRFATQNHSFARIIN